MTCAKQTVAQADREAAASAYYAWIGSNPVIPRKMAAGEADDHSMVQAFARHREASARAATVTLRQSHHYWLLAAKEALQGDLGKLRQHVALSSDDPEAWRLSNHSPRAPA